MGMIGRLADLADPTFDELGLELEAASLRGGFPSTTQGFN